MVKLMNEIDQEAFKPQEEKEENLLAEESIEIPSSNNLEIQPQPIPVVQEQDVPMDVEEQDVPMSVQESTPPVAQEIVSERENNLLNEIQQNITTGEERDLETEVVTESPSPEAQPITTEQPVTEDRQLPIDEPREGEGLISEFFEESRGTPASLLYDSFLTGNFVYSSELRRRDSGLKIGGGEKDSIFMWENIIVPDFIKDEERMTAKDAVSLFYHAQEYIDLNLLGDSNWISGTGSEVFPNGRTFEDVAEGFNRRKLQSYLASPERIWNRDNPNAFEEAKKEYNLNDNLAYINKDKAYNLLPSRDNATDLSAKFFFGLSTDPIISSITQTYPEIFQNQENLETVFGPNVFVDNFGTVAQLGPPTSPDGKKLVNGSFVERIQDIENYKDFGRFIYKAIMTGPAIPAMVSGFSESILDSTFGEGTYDNLTFGIADPFVDFNSLLVDNPIPGLSSSWYAEQVMSAQWQGDLSDKPFLGMFADALATWRGLSKGEEYMPVWGTRARIKSNAEALRNFREGNRSVFEPLDEIFTSNRKGMLAWIERRRAARTANELLLQGTIGAQKTLNQLNDARFYVDVAGALGFSSAAGIRTSLPEGTFLEYMLNEKYGGAIGFSTDMLGMILASRFAPPAVKWMFDKSGRAARAAQFWSKSWFRKDMGKKEYLKDVEQYSDEALSRMTERQVAEAYYASSGERKVMDSYGAFLESVRINDPKSYAQIVQIDSNQLEFWSSLNEIIRYHNDLLPDDSPLKRSPAEIEELQNLTMAELFSNDGIRTYINSQNEIDNLPWSGNINFKKLRIKDAKKIALEKALERHQALADVVRLILPGGALTQEQVSAETAKASELLVNYVSKQEQTLAEELRNLQNEIEVLTEEARAQGAHPDFPKDVPYGQATTSAGEPIFDPIIINSKARLVEDLEKSGINYSSGEAGEYSRNLLTGALGKARSVTNEYYNEKVRPFFGKQQINISDAEFNKEFQFIRDRDGIRPEMESVYADIDQSAAGVSTSTAVTRTGGVSPAAMEKFTVSNIIREGFQRQVTTALNLQGNEGKEDLLRIYKSLHEYDGITEIPDIKVGKGDQAEEFRYDAAQVPKEVLADKISDYIRGKPFDFLSKGEGQDPLGSVLTLDNIQTWRSNAIEQLNNGNLTRNQRRRLSMTVRDLSAVSEIASQVLLNDAMARGEDVSNIKTYAEANRVYMKEIVEPFYLGTGRDLLAQKGGEYLVSGGNIFKEFLVANKKSTFVDRLHDYEKIFPKKIINDEGKTVKNPRRKEADHLLKVSVADMIRNNENISNAAINHFLSPVLGKDLAEDIFKIQGNYISDHISKEQGVALKKLDESISQIPNLGAAEGFEHIGLAKELKDIMIKSPENSIGIFRALQNIDPSGNTFNRLIEEIALNNPVTIMGPKGTIDVSEQVARGHFGVIIGNAATEDIVELSKYIRLGYKDQELPDTADLKAMNINDIPVNKVKQNNAVRSYRNFMNKNNYGIKAGKFDFAEMHAKEIANIRYFEHLNLRASAIWMKQNGKFLDVVDPSGLHRKRVEVILGQGSLIEIAMPGQTKLAGAAGSIGLPSVLAKVFAVFRGVVSLKWIGADAAIRMNQRAQLNATASILQSPHVSARLYQIFQEGRYTKENMNWLAQWARQTIGIGIEHTDEDIINSVLRTAEEEQFTGYMETIKTIEGKEELFGPSPILN